VTEQFGEMKSLLRAGIGTPEATQMIEEPMRGRVRALCEAVLNAPPAMRFLPSFSQAMRRILELTEHPNSTQTFELAEHLGDAVRRMIDETNGAVFMWLEPSLYKYADYQENWKKVIDEFPAIGRDAHEATLCLLFERPTASVFHRMRVMEFGLDKLRRMVKVPKRSPGWDGVIEAIDRKLKPVPHQRKTPATRKRHRYIAEAVLLLRAVKEARNTTMHDYTKSFTIAQAEDQYRAVHNFMTKMADEA
jgi:hypothetical protein